GPDQLPEPQRKGRHRQRPALRRRAPETRTAAANDPATEQRVAEAVRPREGPGEEGRIEGRGQEAARGGRGQGGRAEADPRRPPPAVATRPKYPAPRRARRDHAGG